MHDTHPNNLVGLMENMFLCAQFASLRDPHQGIWGPYLVHRELAAS